jgi:hypothetical protein
LTNTKYNGIFLVDNKSIFENMSKKKILERSIKLLWGKSSGQCAICGVDLTKENKEKESFLIGEMAHIEGEKSGSARYNAKMTDDQRADYSNLILLCPNHHTEVDKNVNDYPVEKLKKIKRDHEKRVNKSLQQSMSLVTFAELEVILKYIGDIPFSENNKDYKVIPIQEKIKKNRLSEDINKLISIGMLQAKTVKDYLNRNPDVNFSSRLRLGFISKYNELKMDGLEGDVLFYELLAFSSGNSTSGKPAGLAVLTYFFELCDVFEK